MKAYPMLSLIKFNFFKYKLKWLHIMKVKPLLSEGRKHNWSILLTLVQRDGIWLKIVLKDFSYRGDVEQTTFCTREGSRKANSQVPIRKIHWINLKKNCISNMQLLLQIPKTSTISETNASWFPLYAVMGEPFFKLPPNCQLLQFYFVI